MAVSATNTVHPQTGEEGLAREGDGDEKLHPAVDLLLKRMESNPQEFVGPDAHKYNWEKVFEPFKRYMTSKEKGALNAALGKLYMDQLHQRVMEKLLDPTGEAAAARQRAEWAKKQEEMNKHAQVSLQQKMWVPTMPQVPPITVDPNSWTGLNGPATPGSLLKGLLGRR